MPGTTTIDAGLSPWTERTTMQRDVHTTCPSCSESVMRDPHGTNYGASDPRKDGAAVPEPFAV